MVAILQGIAKRHRILRYQTTRGPAGHLLNPTPLIHRSSQHNTGAVVAFARFREQGLFRLR